jgi:8-oxo-dGTP pyrophosphatase MutT (NUDIX family)
MNQLGASMKHDNSVIERFQYLLADSESPHVRYANLVPAAVLVLIFSRDGEYFIVFNTRTDKVEYHKGEVCFPGGGQESGDLSPWDTALRETREEMGIYEPQVSYLGRLEPVITSTEFVIYPYVGAVSYPYSYSVNDEEIAEVFEASVSHLLDPVNHWQEPSNKSGGYKSNEVYFVDGHRIVGATARILSQMLVVFQKVLA